MMPTRFPRAKVYLNGRFFAQRVTGVQRYAREMLAELDALLSPGAPGSELAWQLVAPSGTRLPELRHIAVAHRGRLTGHAWEQVELPFIARDGLLVSFGSTGPWFKTGQIVTVHDASVYRVPDAFSWQFRTWYRVVVRQVVQRAERTLAVSNFAAREAREWFGASEERLDVTAEGWQHLTRIAADRSLLDRHGLEPQSYVLAVSSPTPNKNFRVVARAMQHLRGLPLRFVIAGAVDERVLVTQKTDDDARVVRVGYVTDGQLKSLYENALCFVFPSKYEGFGIPALEAMALGCPVVASSIDAAREVCAGAARYFEPHDARGLAETLRELYRSETDRARMVQLGRARASTFSWRASARKGLGAILSCTGSAA